MSDNPASIIAILTKQSTRFLVAKLQLEALKGCTNLNSLRRTADTLPSDLNKMYECTMRRIEAQSPEKARLAKLALMWVSRALRPFRADELQDALATHYEEGTFQIGTFDRADITPATLIASVCCGLMVLEQRDGFEGSRPVSAKYFRLIRGYP